MLAFIAFAFFVLFSIFLTSFSLSHTKLFQRLTSSAAKRITYTWVSTIVTEYAMVLLLLKIPLLLAAMVYGWLEADTYGIVYYADVTVILILWSLYLQSFFAKYHIYEQTKFYRNQTSTEPPLFFSISFWFRFLNPFWYPRHLKVHENLCYATKEELKELGDKNKKYLSLDIYHHPSFPKNRPVLMFLHGGSYMYGSKTHIPPIIPYLALKHYVIVAVNYRLAPDAKYPSQLVDVKRAIRWVRENIRTYGGDPSFIVMSGATMGGHLAMMTALTANKDKTVLQPGFEDVDTSVQACLSINGIYDLTNYKNHFGYNYRKWFEQNVTGPKDDAFFKDASPTMVLKETESQITTGKLEKKDFLPPTMIVHGTWDNIAPIRHVREFVKVFKNVCTSNMCYIELPRANHFFHLVSSPRIHYLSYGIEPFIRSLHEQHQLQGKSKDD